MTTDDVNMSMAGLSDMSMGEINRVASGNDSMADYSMASLNNDESMAGVDDSGYRVPTKHNTSSGVAQLMNNANSTPKDGVGAAEPVVGWQSALGQW